HRRRRPSRPRRAPRSQSSGLRAAGAPVSFRRAGALAALVAATCAGTTVPSAWAKGKPAPGAEDPFYTYAGSLARVAPGTVLKRRTVHLTLALSVHTPISAQQLLYRTTDELRRPSLAVTTVISPTDGTVARNIVSWQPAYDTLGRQCDPSYGLAGTVTPL